MIAIVSSAARERTALVGLSESQGWPTLEYDSVRTLTRSLHRTALRIVIARQKLLDGYSDDVLAHLRNAGRLPETKVIVLIAAGTSSSVEARQLALGADCVQRDPVRINVLIEYLTKYYAPALRNPAVKPTDSVYFAGARIHSAERSFNHEGKTIQLTPREIDLVEMFVQSNGDVITYESLYSEILGRRFRGDTSNMRVLLGKLSASAASLGIPLRRWIEVIPKTGYRYDPSAAENANSK
jgi:DNA-binding response OmpR family regulator